MNFSNLRPYSPSPAPLSLPMNSKYTYPKLPDEPLPEELAAVAGLKIIQTTKGFALTSEKWKTAQDVDNALMQLLITAGKVDLQNRSLSRLRGICNRVIGEVVRLEHEISDKGDPAAYLKRIAEITAHHGLEPMPPNSDPLSPFPDDK